ncbi:beta/alpha barrel domain-containing protein [Roseomonas elaeocarpi]|uniref:NADH:flavin oxidoreductase/NADH oxidase N-terminal domain-containing protein n=1 Tax=Roseomonas elaeocarpi TaxID=907779 RepID=A0ABV6JP43_9PROT
MSPKKILTRLELGRIEIGHRAVLSAGCHQVVSGTRPAERVVSLADSYRRLATPGGLVISTPITARPAATATSGSPLSERWSFLDPVSQAAWRATIRSVHDEGGLLVARMQCPGSQALFSTSAGGAQQGRASSPPEEALSHCGAFATAMRDLEFDGIELCCVVPDPGSSYSAVTRQDSAAGEAAPQQPVAFPAEILQLLIDTWGSDRVGVRLSPSVDDNAMDPFCALLAMLNDLEIAFLHLADAKPIEPKAGGVRITAAAARLRHAFRWPVIASGGFSLRQAVALVDSRWADAICFPHEQDGPTLLEQLTALKS